MGVIAELKAAATETVKAGGFEWKIRKVSSADLAEVGHASLPILPVDLLVKQIVGPKPSKRKAKKQTEAEQVEEWARAIQHMSPKSLRNTKDQEASVVAAGTVAVLNGEGWEPIRMVTGDRESDEANQLLNVRDLPPGVEETLFEAIMSLTSDRGAATDRVLLVDKVAHRRGITARQVLEMDAETLTLEVVCLQQRQASGTQRIEQINAAGGMVFPVVQVG